MNQTQIKQAIDRLGMLRTQKQLIEDQATEIQDALVQHYRGRIFVVEAKLYKGQLVKNHTRAWDVPAIAHAAAKAKVPFDDLYRDSAYKYIRTDMRRV